MCARVFDRFVQGEHRKTHHNTGTGLGLPICKQLAQLMGGDAGVTSREGEGSTFWFTARVTLAPTPALFDSASPARQTSPTHSLEGLKVLIVDDDHAIRDSMGRVLKSHGLHVDAAADGASALELLQRKNYAVLLVDVQMPVMDGMALAQQIRQLPNTRDLKIIGVSAGMLSDDQQHCLDAGMNDYLAKPFQVQHLLEKLRTHAFHSETPN
jgi:CheY-like chemotaxis protein